MLYECVECPHQVSSSAWRCPGCGCENAGSRAWSADNERREREIARERVLLEQEKDRSDPGWREREAAERATKNAFANKELVWAGFWIVYYAYLLPLLAVILGTCYYSIMNDKPLEFGGGAFLMAIPVINWLIIALMVFSKIEEFFQFYPFLMLAVIIGAPVAAITKPTMRQ